MTQTQHTQPSKWTPLGVFGALTWILIAPLLRPGFVFALDMVPTPKWRLPASITSSYPFYVLMHLLNFVLPGDVLQKLLLIVIFLSMGLGGYYLARYIEPPDREAASGYGTYITGLIYVINPYTYSRLMAGQYAVLFGYALLPWLARALLQLLARPSWQQAVRTGLWATAVGIVSIHTLGLALIMAIASLCLAVWRQRHHAAELRKLVGMSLLAAGLFVLASSFWLAPLALGRGNTAAAIHGFGAGDEQTFATVGDGTLDRLAHVGRLEGFWAESTGLYRMPQSIGPVWWLVLAIFMGLVITGAAYYWRTGRRGEVSVLALSALLAALLAAGLFVDWLSGHIPLFAGYREPHKFTGLVALAYALCAGGGAAAALQWTRQHSKRLAAGAAILPVVIAFTLTSSMPLGGGNQLTVSHYPAGWYAVNAALDHDQSRYKVLFLPWHLYMHFGFAATIMANPADNFFDKPVLSSNDPEFGNSSPSTHNPQLDKLSKSILPAAPQRSQLGAQVAPLGVKYIILANESDADTYGYLRKQRDLTVLYHDQTITLYKNTAWQRSP